MTFPHVTELPRQLEAVCPDPFIDERQPTTSNDLRFGGQRVIGERRTAPAPH